MIVVYYNYYKQVYISQVYSAQVRKMGEEVKVEEASGKVNCRSISSHLLLISARNDETIDNQARV